jgi:transposase InsO family protein
MDQGPQFTSRLIEEIMKEHNIHHRKSTPYHPQVNGKVEVTN